MVGLIGKWLMVSFLAFGCLSVITSVGKPRRPLTPGTAAWVVFFNACWITLIVLYWH